MNETTDAEPASMWQQIVDAVSTTLSGDGERGRQMMLESWQATGEGDHAQRCVLAHYLADTEQAVEDEVAWDERALAAYALVQSKDLTPVGIADAAGLAPSLHLNLGDGYLRLNQLAGAQAHLNAGLAAAGVLDTDGYGQMIRGGLHLLRDRLGAAQAHQ